MAEPLPVALLVDGTAPPREHRPEHVGDLGPHVENRSVGVGLYVVRHDPHAIADPTAVYLVSSPISAIAAMSAMNTSAMKPASMRSVVADTHPLPDPSPRSSPSERRSSCFVPRRGRDDAGAHTGLRDHESENQALDATGLRLVGSTLNLTL